MIRLQPLNDWARVRGRTLKGSGPEGFIEGLEIFTYGELDTSPGVLLRGTAKFPYKIIERRAEILQEVTNYERQAQRKSPNRLEIIAGRIELNHHAARFRVDMPHDFRAQGVQMFLSQNDFEMG